MMVNLSVFLKVPFVISGRYDGLIRYRKNSHHCPVFCKWFLDTDPKVGTIRFSTECQYVTTEIDIGMFYSFFYKIILYLICNIAFSDTTQINLCIRI